MTNGSFLDLEAVLALDSHASLAVLDASVAEVVADAADVVAVVVAADADAAVVNQLLEYRFQMDPCMSQCRGLYFILHLYIRDKLRFIG
jgi:hypothetical protein